MIPVRVNQRDGETKYRMVPDLNHATLCRAFGLDPATFYFDLPSSVRNEGANRSGYGSTSSSRVKNGYVFRGPDPEPFGKITIASPGDKFKDIDPTNVNEAIFDLSHH